jgi:hypothetical protein
VCKFAVRSRTAQVVDDGRMTCVMGVITDNVTPQQDLSCVVTHYGLSEAPLHVADLLPAGFEGVTPAKSAIIVIQWQCGKTTV